MESLKTGSSILFCIMKPWIVHAECYLTNDQIGNIELIKDFEHMQYNTL